MLMLKKYAVWISLALTLAATVGVSQQEVDNVIVLAGKNSSSLDDIQANSAKNITEIISQDSEISTNTFMQRSPDNDVPQNIFTTFATAQINPDLNASPASTSLANPFIYAGKIIENGALVVFLIDGEKGHAVKSGDVIEDTWKIKSITPPTMTLKHIPLKVEMQIEIGANS